MIVIHDISMLLFIDAISLLNNNIWVGCENSLLIYKQTVHLHGSVLLKYT